MSKHEVKAKRLAKKLIENKFNATKTYIDYHKCSQEVANKNSYKCMERYGVYERALNILNETDDLSLDKVLLSLKHDLQATKPFIDTTTKKLIYVRDNGVCLDAKRFILSKLYGLDHQENSPKNNTEINITLQDPNIIIGIIDRVKALRDKRDDVSDGEIV